MKNQIIINHPATQNSTAAHQCPWLSRLGRHWKLVTSRLAAVFAITSMALTASAGNQGGSTNLPTIFVAPIVGSPSLSGWRESIGESIADALINQLASSRKFGVLETTALEEIRKEIKMGSDGWMEADDKTEKGHWFGADYMLTGKLMHFESPKGGSGVIQGIPGLFGKRAKVQIIWRVVNASTRKVVASGTADSSKAREGFSFKKLASGILGGGEDGGEALERALDVVLAQIISEVEGLNLARTERAGGTTAAQKAVPAAPERSSGVVEAVKPDFLIVGIGTKHGCKKGDKLELCETTEVKNAEGATVFKDEKIVGEVELEMCIEDRSKARYSSLVTPKEGWVVRCKIPSL